MKKIYAVVFTVVLSLAFAFSSFADFAPLSVGSKGDEVKNVQAKLIEQGYLEGSADGSFGPKTENAVIVYQAKNGLEATGTVDEATYNSIMGTSGSEEVASDATSEDTASDSENVDEEASQPEDEVISFTPEQLCDYSNMFIGSKFRTVVTLVYESDDYLASDDAGGRHFLSYDLYFYFDDVDDLDEKYKDDDVLEITGVIEEDGSDTKLAHCEVLSEGEDAKKALEEIKASSSAQEKIDAALAAQNQAAQDKIAADRDAFAAECETLDYYDILRNPDSYKKRKCKVEGNVIQASEGWFDGITLRVGQDGSSDAVWYVNYTYKEGESHILEGDWVTLYGTCDGTETYTALLGNSITIPEMDAEYVTIH